MCVGGGCGEANDRVLVIEDGGVSEGIGVRWRCRDEESSDRVGLIEDEGASEGGGVR